MSKRHSKLGVFFCTQRKEINMITKQEVLDF